MNKPLNPDVAFCVVMSSCAIKGRLVAIANRKSTAEIDSGNRRREADIKASRAFVTLDSPLNFAFLFPEGIQSWNKSARHRQQQQCAVPGLPATKAERSSVSAEMGVCKVILFLNFQWREFVPGQTKIADGPAGASEDSNNTRFW
jgi:hypothetical protein